MSITDLLIRPVAYHPALARVLGSITAAVMLSQGIYWRIPDKRPPGCPGEDWWYHSIDDWVKETALSRHEQQTARKVLAKTAFWEERKQGIPCRIWYRIDLAELEKELKKQKFARKRKTCLQRKRRPDGRFTAGKATIIEQPTQEITSETISKNTTTKSEGGGEQWSLEEHLELLAEFGVSATVTDKGSYLAFAKKRLIKAGPSVVDLEQYRGWQKKRARQAQMQEELRVKQAEDEYRSSPEGLAAGAAAAAAARAELQHMWGE